MISRISQQHHVQSLLKNGVAKFDREHVIHPYGLLPQTTTPDSKDPNISFPEVLSGKGPKLMLSNGKEVIDGISSWWACIHGYRRKELDDAVIKQVTENLSHVMFGGLTHRPACELIARLLDIVPQGENEGTKLNKVFLCDSGSISVEVAMKMALQYWAKDGEVKRDRFLTTRSGYHGDTFLPMSVSDPVNGMHHLFQGVLTKQSFVSSPACNENNCTNETCTCETIKEMERTLNEDKTIAAVIIEPIFQGAGAMRFYSPALLKSIRDLCNKYEIPLIVDEIATGFGRTGKLFACEHAGIVPDIMCIGKALTGGYVTMGATLISNRIANGITTPLMHGPTFMANPLACAVACASIDLLLTSPWKNQVDQVEALLKTGLAVIKNEFPTVVKDVRVLGAIGVIEFHDSLSVEAKGKMTEAMINQGVWLRPFSTYLYTMPPFNAPLTKEHVETICVGMKVAVQVLFQEQSATKRVKQSDDPITFV